MEDKLKPVWAGFWRRLGAFLIDGLLLGLVGFGVASTMFDLLASIQGPTRLIGLAVGLAYFGILSSGLGGSRTLGMRIVGIKVAGLNGRPLGLLVSLWRALILQGPLMLNGMTLSIPDPLWLAICSVVAITAVFGIFWAQIILLLFNRPSGRLVHDLLSGSVVVRAGAVEIPRVQSRGVIPALAVVALTFGVALGLILYAPGLLPQSIKSLTAPQTAVAALPEVMTAGVQDNTTFSGTNRAGTTRTLIVTARLRTGPKDEDTMIRRVGRAATSVYTLAPGQKVKVVLTYGYDIGIAKEWRSSSYYYTPSQRPSAKRAA